MSNVLFIAPHADDEVLGCGATMRKHVLKGDTVYVIIMTNAYIGAPELFSEEGIANVRNEAIEAHKLIGVQQTFFFDFPAPVLDQFPSYKMSIEILKILKENRIDTVYIPHRGDIHNDHKMVFDAALVACRPVGDYTVKNVYAYETLSETEWGAPFASEIFIPTCFEYFDTKVFEKKLEALNCFKSQMRNFPASRSLETVEALAKFRGSTINKERAEAFMVIRTVS